jgi:hypothetical protein
LVKITHHGIELGELPDEWLDKAGMAGFVPQSKAYNVLRSNEPITQVSIEDVSPLLRKPLFRDDLETGISASDRVMSILRGIRLGDAIPPVDIVPAGAPYPYRLVAGAHRFYCSLAAGFTHVPAIIRQNWPR